MAELLVAERLHKVRGVLVLTTHRLIFVDDASAPPLCVALASVSCVTLKRTWRGVGGLSSFEVGSCMVRCFYSHHT